MPAFISTAKFDAITTDFDGTKADNMGNQMVAVDLMLRDLGLSAVDETVVALRLDKLSENLVNLQSTHASN